MLGVGSLGHMRVALISDIHGSEVALRAVLDRIERDAVDRVVCLGDTATLGPEPGFVLDTLRALGCPCIMGNHDAFLLDPELVHTYTKIQVVVACIDWCRERLSPAQIEFVRTFVPSAEIALGEGATLFAYHGSPRSHTEDILATTPPDALDQFLDGRTGTVLAGGHTHIQMMRQHRGAIVVNPGSVGLPFREYVAGGPPTLMAHAEYAVVEAEGGAPSVTLRRVPLDRGALRASVAASDVPLREMLLVQDA
jgi:predicted phosphodiesterase